MMAYRTAESELIARRSAESIAGGVVSLNRKVEPPLVFSRAPRIVKEGWPGRRRAKAPGRR